MLRPRLASAFRQPSTLQRYIRYCVYPLPLQGVGAVELREDDGEDFGGDQPVDAQLRLEFF